MLEKSNEDNEKTDQIVNKHTKTNMNLNYGPEKNLILEMETENHEIRNQIIITPSGMVGTFRNKLSENDTNTFFGYKYDEAIVSKKNLI